LTLSRKISRRTKLGAAAAAVATVTVTIGTSGTNETGEYLHESNAINILFASAHLPRSTCTRWRLFSAVLPELAYLLASVRGNILSCKLDSF